MTGSTSGYVSIGFGSSMNNAKDYIMGYYEGSTPRVNDYTPNG